MAAFRQFNITARYVVASATINTRMNYKREGWIHRPYREETKKRTKPPAKQKERMVENTEQKKKEKMIA